MKKLFALILTGTLIIGAMTGCGSTAVVTVPQSQAPSSKATEPPQKASQGTASGESVKTGFYMGTRVSGSKNAADGKDGTGQADIDLVAVTVTEDGVIDSCVIDSIQSKITFDGTGKITADLTASVPTKKELGGDYGMAEHSPIGKEWDAQIQALTDYVVGKTVDEIQGITVTEDGKTTDADLSSSVTISIANYLEGIQQAVANATDLGAKQGDRLAIATSTNISGSKDAGGEDGLAQTYATVAAVTLNGETVTSCYIDAVQANVNFDASGAITTDLTAAQPSKNELGDDYGMRKASSISKEWNEQAAAFCSYVTGKTLDEVAGIAVDEKGVATDADLASSVTLSLGDFQALVAKAGE